MPDTLPVRVCACCFHTKVTEIPEILHDCELISWFFVIYKQSVGFEFKRLMVVVNSLTISENSGLS